VQEGLSADGETALVAAAQGGFVEVVKVRGPRPVAAVAPLVPLVLARAR
jgi:hypothetical protein